MVKFANLELLSEWAEISTGYSVLYLFDNVLQHKTLVKYWWTEPLKSFYLQNQMIYNDLILLAGKTFC